MTDFLPTMLFVPGDDSRKLAKIPEIAAPAFILDLEDAVASSAKATARLQVREAVTAHGGTSSVWVRVNAASSGLLPVDLDAVVTPGLAGVVIPKAECGRDLAQVEEILSDLERERGLAPGSVRLTAIIETARGLASLPEITRSSTRLRFLCFGAGDLSLDLNLDWTPDSGISNPTIIAAKTRLVIESRSAGLLAPHDGSFPHLDRPGDLHTEARYARSLGFGGKHAIHPGQVEVICDAFRPTDAEVNQAREQLSAFEAAEEMGLARLTVAGKFVDYPVAERARRVLATAEQWGQL
jgi:citrate lyase beta subunit